MLELENVFTAIYKGLMEVTSQHKFHPVFPDGVKKSEVPVYKRNETETLIDYKGEKTKLRVLFTGNKIFLLNADLEAVEDDDSEYSCLSTCLLELETNNEKDVKFIIGEFSETITENYGKKQLIAQRGKAPLPVSRAAAKSGALSYDSNTLANRLVTNYPELKDAYKDNLENFGDFLAEDFFLKHGNQVVQNIIRQNNPQAVKKLFSLLNEIYSDGTNEVQSLIVVTILGEAGRDSEAHKIILENISDLMIENFIHVSSILSKSKSSNMRLSNPPVFKPKKTKKKNGFLSQIGLG